MTRPVTAVDLFCGAGGTSSGAFDACKRAGRTLDLIAVNHWAVAIATHERNLPGVKHYCAAVESLSPRDVVPSGTLDVLLASPECKHFSTARGGRPINDQKRADPWQVVRWASELRIDSILIENVPEFRSWGPIGANGRPLKSKRGRTYQAYLEAFRALGYTVEDRLLCAADYGDPTTRRRLFIIARRGKAVRWPAASHARPTRHNGLLPPGLKPWRAAKEIIDWSIAGESIFGRKHPLSSNTMKRIIAGLQRFGGPELGPFLVVLRGTDPEQLRQTARPIELPLDAVCSSNHFGLVEPVAGAFLLGQQSGSIPRHVDDPVPTVATGGAISMVEFLVPRYGERPGQAPRTHSVDEPMPTVPSSCQHGVAQAFLLPPLGIHHRDGKANKARSLEDPVQTVTASRGGGHLVEPVLVHVNHGDNPKGGGRGNGGRARPVSDPLPTVTRSRGLALVEALISKYYGTGIAKPVTEPLDAVTTKDRFGLVTFERGSGLALDIRFRMLRPHELAGAQGLEAFTFAGNIGDQVAQIGNAVPRRLAAALVGCLL